MRDVARLAGVSVKTVSNVVNGYPYIRPETKERVEDAIRQLDYQVNVSARNLRQGRTGLIGLAVPELSLSYFAELADLVIAEARARGYDVLIEPTGGTREGEFDVLDGPRRAMTDGLIFSALAMRPDEGSRLHVDYPLVLLGEQVFDPQVDHVTMRNAEAAQAATRHLIARGCRRVAAIGTITGEPVGSARLRLEGYLAALEEAGLPAVPELIGEARVWHRAHGEAAMTKMLDSGAAPDGVFAFNDALALGVIHALHARGFAVPDDVAVIGFDDVDDARYSVPSLSTIAPGRQEIARVAVQFLDEQIRSAEAPREHRLHLAAYQIVVRDSSAPTA
jgi:DNA-binding LacI/PurR family transcriptional regulator